MMNRMNKFRAVFLAMFVLALAVTALLPAASKAFYVSQFGGLSIYFDPDTVSTGDVLAHMTKDPSTGTTLTGPARYRSYRAAAWPTETINLPATADSVAITGTAASFFNEVLDTASMEVPTTQFQHEQTQKARYALKLPEYLAGTTENATVSFFWTEATAESGGSVVWKFQYIASNSDVTGDVSPTYVEVEDATSNDVDILHRVDIVQPLSTWAWDPDDFLNIEVSRDGTMTEDSSGVPINLHAVTIQVPISPVRE